MSFKLRHESSQSIDKVTDVVVWVNAMPLQCLLELLMLLEELWARELKLRLNHAVSLGIESH